MGGPPLSPRELLTAVGFTLFSVIAIILVWLAFGGHLPFQVQGYRFTADFANAPTLVPGSSVRIAGVPVGSVVSVSAGESSTDAVIQLDPQYVPIPRDARAIVRTKTPLGESYVELTPGTPGSPALRDGATLPSDQVGQTQQISDILATFNRPTRRAFESTLVDTAAALNGEGPNLNAALGAGGNTTAQLNVLMQALASQSGDVQTLISRTRQALHAISADPTALRRLITAGSQVASATAERSAALAGTVKALAPFVRKLNSTAPALTETSNLATPTLKVLVGVAPLVLPALDSVDRLAPRLTTVFRALRPTIRAGETGLQAAARLLHAVPPLGTALDLAGRQLVPLVELLRAYDYDAVQSLASFASVLEPVKGTSGDTGSRYARTAILFATDGDLGFTQRQPSNRYSPYPPPGQLGDAKSVSCANTKNAATVPAAGSQVPCVVQPAWTFRGKTANFPDLSPYYPPADR